MRFARAPTLHVGHESPWRFVVGVFRNAKRHRTTGHAAEMAFFAVVTLVPSTVAVGSAPAPSSAAASAPRVSR